MSCGQNIIEEEVRELLTTVDTYLNHCYLSREAKPSMWVEAAATMQSIALDVKSLRAILALVLK